MKSKTALVFALLPTLLPFPPLMRYVSGSPSLGPPLNNELLVVFSIIVVPLQ